jgi:hypothetical protein
MQVQEFGPEAGLPTARTKPVPNLMESLRFNQRFHSRTGEEAGLAPGRKEPGATQVKMILLPESLVREAFWAEV